jgi:phage terminase small subunit
MNTLNEKQKAFCREYILDFNQTKAAIRAGYSKRSADRIGSRLMRKDEVKAYVAELKQIAADKAEITPEWVLSKLRRVVEMGLGNEQTDVIVKENVAPGVSSTMSQKMTKADIAAAKSALDLLGRYHGIFTDNTKVEHSGQIIKRVIKVNPTKDK